MTIEEKKARYQELAHAMQSGVAFLQQRDPSERDLKHMRVGVNSAMLDAAAVASLLMKKGLITEDEYLDSLIERFEEEVARYTERVRAETGGANVNLA